MNTMNKTISTDINDIKAFAEIAMKANTKELTICKWVDGKFFMWNREITEVEVYSTDNYVTNIAYYGSVRVMSDVWDGGIIIDYSIYNNNWEKVDSVNYTNCCGWNRGVLVKSTKNEITLETKTNWYNKTLDKAIDMAMHEVHNLNLPCKIVGGNKFKKSKVLYIKDLHTIEVNRSYGWHRAFDHYYYVYDLTAKKGDRVATYNVEITEEGKNFFVELGKKIVAINDKLSDIEGNFNNIDLAREMANEIIKLYRPIAPTSIFADFGDITTEKAEAKKAKIWNEKKAGVVEWAKKKNPTADEAEIERIVECVRRKYYA